jgi:hypothetical protein
MPETSLQATHAITTFQPSENLALSRTLMGLETGLEAAARQNLDHVLGTQGTNLQAFTDLEIQAMVLTEELRLVNGIDLASLLLRGKLIKDIEDRALFTVHPNGFANLTELAVSVNISVSELSDIRTLTQVIFPWITENLRDAAGNPIPIAGIWDSIGKTKFRTMTPILAAMISGEPPNTESARRNYDRMLDTTAVDMRDAGEEPTPATVRDRAARQLIQTAGEETTRGLQETIRDGNPTPAITPLIVNINGQHYLISEVDEDQMVILGRKLGRHMAAPDVLDLPPDRMARQREAFRNPVMRAIYQAFEGE